MLLKVIHIEQKQPLLSQSEDDNERFHIQLWEFVKWKHLRGYFMVFNYKIGQILVFGSVCPPISVWVIFQKSWGILLYCLLGQAGSILTTQSENIDQWRQLHVCPKNAKFILPRIFSFAQSPGWRAVGNWFIWVFSKSWQKAWIDKNWHLGFPELFLHFQLCLSWFPCKKRHKSFRTARH